jgi:hypothetical protein
VNLWHL